MKKYLSLLLFLFPISLFAACEDIVALMGAGEPLVPWYRNGVVEPSRKYHAQLTYFRIPTEEIPFFLRRSQQVQEQLAATDGLVDYSMHGRTKTGEFWTISLWEGTKAKHAFLAQPGAHDLAQRDFNTRMLDYHFEEWEAMGLGHQVSWVSLLATRP